MGDIGCAVAACRKEYSLFQAQEGTPRDVRRFEQLWSLAIFLSAMVAIEAFDYTVKIIGPYPALLTNVGFFGVLIALVAYASRRRSSVARFLTIPFLLSIIVYDILLFFSEMTDREAIGYYSLGTVGRLGLIMAGIYLLFTPSSRAWFAGKPLPEDDAVGV